MDILLKKIAGILFIIILVMSTAFFAVCSDSPKQQDIIADMEYIQFSESGEIIELAYVTAIEPTIWKGSYEGVLFYENGESVDIKISDYGDFFAVKDNERGLFSDGILYSYTVK